jgi:hypothetical protein
MANVRELDVEKWILRLAAVAAVAIGVIDFTSLIELPANHLLRIVLIAIGLTMAAVSTQTSKRFAEMNELRHIFGAASIELIENQKDFEDHSKQSAARAQRFILHTRLGTNSAKLVHPLDDFESHSKVIYERVSRGEIRYQRIETFANKDRFELAVFRLLVYEGLDYRVRYFSTVDPSIPVLNLMSIDNEAFYLGGFYISDAPSDTSSAVLIKSSQMQRLFKSYWDNLWLSARPLNENGRIDWGELGTIANRIGMTDGEFCVLRERLQKEARSKQF